MRTCSPPGSRCGSPNATTSAWSSAKEPATGVPAATRSPRACPASGYVGIDGVAEPVRVRFAHVTDADITTLCHTYAPRPRVRVATPVEAGLAVRADAA